MVTAAIFSEVIPRRWPLTLVGYPQFLAGAFLDQTVNYEHQEKKWAIGVGLIYAKALLSRIGIHIHAAYFDLST